MLLAHPRDRGRHQLGQGAGQSADPQPGALTLGRAGQLRLGKAEAVGDRIGVLEQDLALGGEAQAPRTALEQLHAHLALQRRHLVGHRWLRQGEPARRA